MSSDTHECVITRKRDEKERGYYLIPLRIHLTNVDGRIISQDVLPNGPFEGVITRVQKLVIRSSTGAASDGKFGVGPYLDFKTGEVFVALVKFTKWWPNETIETYIDKLWQSYNYAFNGRPKTEWVAPHLVNVEDLVTINDERFNKTQIRSVRRDNNDEIIDDVNPESLLYILGEGGLHLPETTAPITYSTIFEDYFNPKIEEFYHELRYQITSFLKMSYDLEEGNFEAACEANNTCFQPILDMLRQ